MNRPHLIASLLVYAAAVSQAGDWTRFRGDNGQGLSPDSVPLEWSAEKNLRWRCALPGPGSSSPVAAAGKVIAVSRRGGTFVFAAEPEFQLLAHNTIAGDESQFHGTPAISDGQLFLRSDNFLYCISE